MIGTKLKASCMLDKSSATESHPSLMNSFLGADRPHFIIDTALDMDRAAFNLRVLQKSLL